MSGELAFFELGVEDADRARAFYGALFGWTFRPGPSGGGGSLIETPSVPGGAVESAGPTGAAWAAGGAGWAGSGGGAA